MDAVTEAERYGNKSIEQMVVSSDSLPVRA